jgi:recombination protein RecR
MAANKGRAGKPVRRAIPEPVTRLIEAFSRLPGIGPKTASRLTYYLLRAPDEEAEELARAVADIKERVHFCSLCFNITEIGVDPCAICTDPERIDNGLLTVVENPLDVMAIERTGSFEGRYHVLQGAISPVDGIGPDQLRIRELVDRVAHGDVDEIIIATNPGIQGDATAMYIRRELEGEPVHVTRLARGLPSGGELEYVDSVTLLRAFEGRHEM